MEFKWEVDDGYVCGDRPQSTEIDDDELREFAENANGDIDAIIDYIADYIQCDYEQTISWHFKDEERIQRQIKKLLK